MDIELLRTFLEVVRTRHFGKAAAELCVTQSAVSARIRQLGDTKFSCRLAKVAGTHNLQKGTQ